MTSPSVMDKQPLPRRRRLTYGKRTRLPGSSYDFDGSSKPASLPIPSKAAKPKTASVALANERSVFDVPLSDEEDAKPKQITGRLKKVQKSEARIEAQDSGLSQYIELQRKEDPSPASSTTSKKRKRDAPAERPSPGGTNKQRAEEVITERQHGEDLVLQKAKDLKIGVLPSKSDPKRPQPRNRKTSPRIALAIEKSTKPLLATTFESTIDLSSNLRVTDNGAQKTSQSPPHTPTKDTTPMRHAQERSKSTSTKPTTLSVQTSPQLRPSLTPQQSQIWNRLFQDDEQVVRQHLDPESPPNLPAMKGFPSTQQPARRRLIDTLLPSSDTSRPLEDDDGSDFSSENEEDSNTPKGPSQQKPGSAAVSQQSTLPVGGPRRTYASQRSFLQEQSTQLEDLLSMPFEIPISPVAQSRGRRDFSSTFLAPTAPSEEEEEEESREMKSIHELRAAGDSQRQDDEINLLLEDLTDGPHSIMSIRRSGGLDLAQKLADENFRDRFMQHGHVRRAFSTCRRIEDPILGTAIVSAMTWILVAPASKHNGASIVDAGIIELITRMLDFDKDVLVLAKDRSSNMSRLAQANVKDFSESIRQSSWWKTAKLATVSPQLVALKGLEVLVRKLREAGNMDDILGVKLVGRLLDTLQSFCRQIATQSKPLPVTTTAPLEIILSCMESYTVSPACAQDKLIWPMSNLHKLVNAVDATLCNSPTATECLALRTCLNLANNSKRNSEAFAKPALISKMTSTITSGLESISAVPADDTDHQQPPHGFDVLVLALGALINLAEWSASVRAATLAHAAPQLASMLAFFNARHALAATVASLAESHANVAYGYLAVLLCNLCASAPLRAHIQVRLPNARLAVLGDAVDEFIAHHKVVDTREQGTEVWAAFTERLQAVADALRRVA